MKDHKPVYQDLEDEITRLKSELIVRDEMINSIPNPLFVKNKDFKYTNCNDAFADYLGLPKSKIINSTVYDISPKELADKYYAADCELRDQSGKQEYESKVKFADGTVHDIIFNKASLVDEENEFSGIVGIMLDITEHKRAEEALDEKKNLLAKSESISNQGSWKWSIDDDDWSFSDSWLNIHGLNHTGISQKELMKIAHPDDAAKIEEAMSNALNNNLPYSLEHRIIREDNGEVRIIKALGEVHFNEKGKPEYMIGVAQDITEQKQVEDELLTAKEKAEESEKKYRALFENAPLPYQSLNEDGSFKDVNPAWLTTLGYTREEIIGKLYKDFLHPDWQGHFEKNFPAFKKRGYVNDVHFRIRHKKGHYIDISFEGCIGYHPDGSFKSTYCVFQDITQKRQIESELIDAKEKAEENEEKFKLLNRLTSEMLLLHDEESIYKFIADNLQKLYPNTIVLNVSIDESIQQTRLEVISGLDNSLLAKVIKISGFNPIGKTYKLTDIHNKYFRSGDFIEFDGGLAEFSASEFPAVAASAIEKLIGLHKIYTIGINKDDGLLAAIHFFTFNNQVISDGNFIEVFAKQAGLVLQKRIDEEALKIAKEKAEESGKQLKLIADNFVNGMIYQVAMLDENRRKFNYISKNVNELYGCTVEEAKENADLIYGKLHPDDINGLIEKEKDALKTMSVFETEARAIKPNGDIRWAYYISQPRIINGIVCWDGIEIDITERKRMELELINAKEKAEESEHRLKLASSWGNLVSGTGM